MSITLIVLLILCGLLFVILEILVIPGVGVVGILGGAMIIFAIVAAYGLSPLHGHLALAGSLVLSALSIFISIKSNTWKHISLGSSIDSKVNTREENQVIAGDVGVAISRLNPIGKAMIKEEIFEVESREGYIAENQNIEVVSVTTNKITVKSKL
jgi:membrane-bound ClpP family serine protease